MDFPKLFSSDEIIPPPSEISTSHEGGIYHDWKTRNAKLSATPSGEVFNRTADLILIATRLPHLKKNLFEAEASGMLLEYLDSMMIDWRHDRSGFPEDVSNAILRLRTVRPSSAKRS